MLTEIANEAIGLTGGHPITVANNLYFSAVSLLFLCVVATFITERMIEPRLGAYDAQRCVGGGRCWPAGRGADAGGSGRRVARLALCASSGCSAFW